MSKQNPATDLCFETKLLKTLAWLRSKNLGKVTEFPIWVFTRHTLVLKVSCEPSVFVFFMTSAGVLALSHEVLPKVLH